MNQSNNYRALSCVIGKLLDKVILSKCQELTDTSQQQFGFKKAHSTTQCTFIVNEVVQLYNSSGSDVYIALLDASRAFDRVEYIKLFEIKPQTCNLSSLFKTSTIFCYLYPIIN